MVLGSNPMFSFFLFLPFFLHCLGNSYWLVYVSSKATGLRFMLVSVRRTYITLGGGKHRQYSEATSHRHDKVGLQ